ASRSFRNWLFQIAANEARDRYRKRARETAAYGDVVDSMPYATAGSAADGPEAGRERQEIRSDILRSLAALSPREREVLVLRDLEDLDIAETARTLGCSAIAVRVHLSKARRKLAEVLRRDFPHLEEGR